MFSQNSLAKNSDGIAQGDDDDDGGKRSVDILGNMFARSSRCALDQGVDTRAHQGAGSLLLLRTGRRQPFVQHLHEASEADVRHEVDSTWNDTSDAGSGATAISVAISSRK